MHSPSLPSRPAEGILWMLLSTCMFVAVTAVVRHLGPAVPAAQSAFLRYLIGLVFVIPILPAMLRASFSGRDLRVFGFRGAVHSIGVILWFFAMARIPIAEVTSIGFMEPIFTAIGAVFLFGERMAYRRIVAIALAFAGILVIMRPGFREVGAGHLAILAATPMFALSYLTAKALAGRAGAGVVVGMLSVFVTAGLAPFAIAVWEPPSLSAILWLGLVACFATAGHYTMTRALRAAPVVVTQPVNFLRLVWATLLGVFVFSEPLDFWTLLGGTLIICSVSYISYRDWKIERRAIVPPVAAGRY